MEQQLVVFELAGESYGIRIAVVESIIKMQAITQLPHASAYIKGVTNLRGSVLPVIDLRKRFNLDSIENTRQTRIIIVSQNEIKAGIIVDGVSEVLRIQDESIEPISSMVGSVNSDFLQGIVRQEGRLIILLELEKVLGIRKHHEEMKTPSI